MAGKIASIAGVAEGIDLCLEEHDNVGVFGVRDGTQEDGGVGARIEVFILLGLQAKVQEMSLANVEHVGSRYQVGGRMGTVGSKPGTVKSKILQRRS